jgi:hypothetical protein
MFGINSTLDLVKTYLPKPSKKPGDEVEVSVHLNSSVEQGQNTKRAAFSQSQEPKKTADSSKTTIIPSSTVPASYSKVCLDDSSVNSYVPPPASERLSTPKALDYGESKFDDSKGVPPEPLMSGRCDSDEIIELTSNEDMNGSLDHEFEPADGDLKPPAVSDKLTNGEPLDVPDDAYNIPDWDNMTLQKIYLMLNPTDNQKQLHKNKWLWKQKVSFSTPDVKKGVVVHVPTPHMGILLNKLICLMVENHWMPQKEQNKKAMKKEDQRAKQLYEFSFSYQDLKPPVEESIVLKFVREFLKTHIKPILNASGELISKDDVPVNTGARIILLTKDEKAMEVLKAIYSTAVKEEERASLDNKAESINHLWECLAAYFVDDSNFIPENTWAKTDSRLNCIDPRSLPEDEKKAWNGGKLRTWFSKYKSYFSRVAQGFNSTGRYQGGAGVVNGDEFLITINAALAEESDTTKLIILFAFYVWEGYPPQIITRSKPIGNQYDTSGRPTDVAENNRKRVKVSPGKAVANALITAMAPTEHSITVDKSYVLANTSQVKRNDAEADMYSAMAKKIDMDVKKEKLNLIREAMKDPFLTDADKEKLKEQYMNIFKS